MGAPTSFHPQIGDVLLVRATISRITRGASDEEPLIAARTPAGRLVSCKIGDIEKVEAFVIQPGARVRWWEEAEHRVGGSVTQAGWRYGEVLAIEQAKEPEDRPHRDNLWIKDETRWPRLTKQRKDVERA